MQKSTITLALMAAIACLTVSCQKIERPAQAEANLRITSMQFTDAIPVAYGQLVSVTPSPDAYNAVMWFRKSDESIVLVRINYARGALGSSVIEIPRK